MNKKEVLTDIQQKWIHSYEEDTATETVYRPEGYKFPRSRGRVGFELKANSELVENNIAPTDAITEEVGSWRLKTDESDNLQIELNPANASSRMLTIESVGKDRLVVKK